MASTSRFPNLANWLFTSGAVAIQVLKEKPELVAGIGLAAAPWLGPVAAVAGGVLSYTINRITSAHDKSKELQQAARELLTNRDIALAQAKGIAARLRRYADELGGGKVTVECKRLRQLADAAEVWWLAAVTDPARADLAALRDDEVVNTLTDYLTTDDPFEITEATWIVLLEDADRDTPGKKFGPKMAAYFAKHLGGSFRHDFVEALKTDLLTDGKAFAAVTLRYFAELLSEIRMIRTQEAAMKSELTGLSDLLVKLEKAVAALHAAPGLTPESLTHIEAAEKRLRFDIDVVLLGVDELLLHAQAQSSENQALRDELKSLKLLLLEALGRIPKTDAAPRISNLSFIHHAAENFIGRDSDRALLDAAWADGTNVFVITAWGGTGKTALIADWLKQTFIAKHWLDENGKPALRTYFDWSFYDQGTRAIADGSQKRSGSVGDFFEQALRFFGDPNPSDPILKSQRLLDLVRKDRNLIILDGLEPIQQPICGPDEEQALRAGSIIDLDLVAVIRGLATLNPGLCVITSRQDVTDLKRFDRPAVDHLDLKDLPEEIAIKLLRDIGVVGTDNELKAACKTYECHALSLNLLGRYLVDVHPIFVDDPANPSKRKQVGDIRRLDQMRDLKQADYDTRVKHETRHRNAWKILQNYESWLASAKEDGNPKTLAVLRLTGLFDRTATADCLAALRAEPIITGLTDPICGIADDEWNILLKRLERAHLIKLRESANRAGLNSDSAWAIDVHPIIRHYFAQQLKVTLRDAAMFGHERLFRHLEANSEDDPETLEDLQPLYQAVFHGCQSGDAFATHDALHWVLERRIQGHNRFSTFRLGAYSQELQAVGAFFEKRWTQLLPSVFPSEMVGLLASAGFCLRSLGQLAEAAQVMQHTLELRLAQEPVTYLNLIDHKSIMIAHNNLCELYMLQGKLDEAVDAGRRAVSSAFELLKTTGEVWEAVNKSCTLADALLQSGTSEQLNEAANWFKDAQLEMKQTNRRFPILHSIMGFRYCDWLLLPSERAAWRCVVTNRGSRKRPNNNGINKDTKHALGASEEAFRRTEQVFQWRKDSPHWNHSIDPLLDIAHDHLTLARAVLYQALILGDTDLVAELQPALLVMRQANRIDHFPKVLLTAAFYHGTLGENLEEAERLLEEAQQIAERGPLPLYLADVHLHRARLFGRMNADERKLKFPEIDPKAELRAARRLIEKHGYWRRKEELEDAEAAAVNW